MGWIYLYRNESEKFNTISGTFHAGKKNNLNQKLKNVSVVNTPLRRQEASEDLNRSTKYVEALHNQSVGGVVLNEQDLVVEQRRRPKRKLLKRVINTSGRKMIQTAADSKRTKSRPLNNTRQNAAVSSIIRRRKRGTKGSQNLTNYTINARNPSKNRKENKLVKQIKGFQYIKNQKTIDKTKSQTSLGKKKRSYTEDFGDDQKNIIASLNKHIANARKKRMNLKTKNNAARTSPKIIYGTSSPNTKTILAISSPNAKRAEKESGGKIKEL
ncbi:unnamed protein product [Moneuplotes crassus]|uniref:Uncharacterized protein n=1 Tax=Euplotes crassus TaxID=5936 RepID=A0AAD1U6Q2_EUPCR|nr:unnamed protein product [Moneuplotes crassus]